MASSDNSNGVAPSIAGFGGSSGSSSGGASDAQTTPAQNAAGSGPQGPNSAGLNPGVATPNVAAPVQTGASGFSAIASQRVADGGQIAAQPPVAPRPYTQEQLVQSLANHLGVKAKIGQDLEVAVAEKLEKDYHVQLQPTMTTTGTGTGQGTVGQARHFTAGLLDSWFKNAFSNNVSNNVPTQKGASAKTEDQLDEAVKQAMAIKSPKLRQQAMEKAQNALKQYRDQYTVSASTPQPVADQSDISGILKEVAKDLGQNNAPANAQQDLSDIAKDTGAQYEVPGTPAQPAQPQTYAENYAAFTKAWAANKKLTSGANFQEQWTANLENAGLLNADINTAATSEQQQTQAKGGSILSTTVASGPTEQQVFNAYQELLVQSQAAKQAPAAYLQANASNSTAQTLANGAPSEMYAFVQGVGTEMGVDLTPAQINQLSNFYGASASTADDPSSVEDQIKDAVVSLYDPTNPNNPAGVASTMFEDIKSAALSYQIPISDSQIGNMVKTDLQGTTVESMYVAADAAEAAATKQFQQQAAGLYPALSSQIQAGQTVQNLVAPYFNVAEAITGVPAATMTADMSTGGVSKWSAFLQGGTNPSGSTQANNETGKAATTQPQMMTLDQWKTYLMQTPQYGFQNTQGGKDMAEQMSAAILNAFGKVNTMGGTSTPFNAYNGQADLSANTSG